MAPMVIVLPGEKARGRLVRELGFTENEADRAVRSGAGPFVLELRDKGEALSEDDPVLFIAPDASDTIYLHYFNNGNYGLPPAVPGALPWPGGGPPAPGESAPICR